MNDGKWNDFYTVLFAILEIFSMKFGKQPTYFIFQDCNKRLHFAFQCNLHRVKIAHAFKFIFGSSSNMSVIWFLIFPYLKVWVFNTKPLLSSYQNCPNARCNGNYSVVKILIPWNKPVWFFFYTLFDKLKIERNRWMTWLQRYIIHPNIYDWSLVLP